MVEDHVWWTTIKHESVNKLCHNNGRQKRTLNQGKEMMMD